MSDKTKLVSHLETKHRDEFKLDLKDYPMPHLGNVTKDSLKYMHKVLHEKQETNHEYVEV